MKLSKFNIIDSNNFINIIKYLVLFTSILLMADCTLAADSFATKFCQLGAVIKGPIGVGICTLAIIGIAISFLMGKVDMKTFILTALGILGIFYAQDIVYLVTQEQATKDCVRGLGS